VSRSQSMNTATSGSQCGFHSPTTRPSARTSSAKNPPASWTPPRGPRRFVIAFLVYDAITALIPTIDQRLNTYPFSAFPMFATVRAKQPYDRHLPYTVPGDHFVAISDRPIDDRAQRWLDYHNRRLYTVTDPSVFRIRLAAILAEIQARFPEFGIHGLRHYFTIFEAPAYPTAAHFEQHLIAVTGEIDATGAFRTVLGALDATGVTLRPQGVDTAGAHLVSYLDDDPAPHPLAAPRTGDRFATGPIAGDSLCVVAVVGDTPWLVATRKTWRWE
jgi:hypothetical protein